MKNQRISVHISITFLSVMTIMLIGASHAMAGVMGPRLISRTAAGVAGNAQSINAVTSADGRFVVFESDATNLVAGVTDANNTRDIFLYDAQTDSLRCISVNTTGTATGNNFSANPVISSDGHYVVFRSAASDLVANDTNGFDDVFRYDTSTGQTVMVSRTPDGLNGGNGHSGTAFGAYKPYDISDDGRYIVFVSLATNLTAISDTNNATDVFVRDMQTNTTQLISIATNGTAVNNPNNVQLNSCDVNISADGKFITFQSAGSNLVSGITDGNLRYDVLLKNMQTGELKYIAYDYRFANTTADAGSYAPVLSKSGNRIVYSSNSSTITRNKVLGNGTLDVFVYDIGLATNFLVSVNSAGTDGGDFDSSLGNPESQRKAITPDGRYIVFSSRATNLDGTVTDTNGKVDVFRRDLATGRTQLVSVNLAGNASGNDYSTEGLKAASISDDGRFIAFGAAASTLLQENFAYDNAGHTFIRDMQLNNTFTTSANLAGSSFANASDYDCLISRNGKSLVFWSLASNLTSNTDTNNAADMYRVRLTVPGNAVSDYDGDGKTDFVVFRPTNGYWYTIPNTLQYTAGTIPWGANGDKPLAADFSGDGRSDYTVFRPSTGTWFIINSSNFNTTTTNFGQAGDIPMPADYDGDGKADIAVFRPSNGTWYILRSTDGQAQITNFGLNGDIPVSVDLDGDGRTDIAVFRPSDGNWYYLRSSDGGFRTVHFGQSGDKPVPADYDSDGKTDLAVYRSGTWYILESRTGNLRTISFGLATDVPVPGNYDGDGKADIAVWRPTDGNWYMLRSSDAAFQAFHFGQTGDIPLAADLGQ